MRSFWFGALACWVVLALAGCGSTDRYSAQTAQLLQQRVLRIAAAAQSRSYASALQQLTQLAQADDQALTDGSITRVRHDAIAASIVKVRADLTALESTAHVGELPPTRTKHPKKDGGGNGGGGGGAGGGGSDGNSQGGD